ncbi:MAG: hypothetical protein Kow0063_20700 [Anaerolineae bacterium]
MAATSVHAIPLLLSLLVGLLLGLIIWGLWRANRHEGSALMGTRDDLLLGLLLLAGFALGVFMAYVLFRIRF